MPIALNNEIACRKILHLNHNKNLPQKLVRLLLVWGRSGMEWSCPYFLDGIDPDLVWLDRKVHSNFCLVRRIWWDGTRWSFNSIRHNNPWPHHPLSLHLFLLSSSGEQSMIPKILYHSRSTSHSSGAQQLGTTTAQELGQPIRPRSHAEILALPPPEMLNLPHQSSHVARGGNWTHSSYRRR
jgi:hypothetical protein